MGMMIDLQASVGPALVVGGGSIAARKVRLLNQAEFEVVVIAPVVLDAIRHAPFTTVIERPFEKDDIDRRVFGLAFACTDDRGTNRLVGELARTRRIPVVVADAGSESTFHTPATLREGNVSVAVSTGGLAPGVAKLIRERIAAQLGPLLTHQRWLASQQRRDDMTTAEYRSMLDAAYAEVVEQLKADR